jgi:hypothetical protein
LQFNTVTASIPKDEVSTIDQYFDIDRMMSENELLLAYRDHITESTVQQLLSITELKLVQSGEDKKLRKRVFNILVECLQNIVNHAEQTNEDSVASLLLIGRHNSDFFIVTGNRIRNSKISALEAKIEEINSWDHSDMREIYSSKLGKSEYSEKGGAGLGLLDIYKRSGRKLKYTIQPVNDEVSLLSFHISIGAED